MRTMFALIGAFTVLLGLLGAFGVGNFVMTFMLVISLAQP